MRECLWIVAWSVSCSSLMAQYPTNPVQKTNYSNLRNTNGGLPTKLIINGKEVNPNDYNQPKKLSNTIFQSPALPITANPVDTKEPMKVVDFPTRPQVRNFDHNSVQVRWVQGNWYLYAGTMMLKDFGSDQYAAREAARMIQQLKLNAHGVVGQPSPIMEYWLSNGKAPRTTRGLLRTLPIDLESLRAQDIQGQWCVLDNARMFFNFGKQKAQAQEAVNVMRKYRFGEIGYLGYPKPHMIYFLGQDDTIANRFTQLPKTTNPTNNGNNIPGNGNPNDRGYSIDSSLTKLTKQSGDFNQKFGDISPAVLQQARLFSQGHRQLSEPVNTSSGSIRINPRELTVRLHKNHWQIRNGEYVLVDFGTDSQLAQSTLRMLQYYGCTEQVMLSPSCNISYYFLVNGHAPRGLRYGMQGREFRPEKTSVRAIGHQWYIMEETTPLILVGESRQDAEELLAAIQRYQFDFFTQLGSTPGHSMPFFARRR